MLLISAEDRGEQGCLPCLCSPRCRLVNLPPCLSHSFLSIPKVSQLNISWKMLRQLFSNIKIFVKYRTTEQKVEVVGEDLHFPHALKQFVTESAKDGRPAGCGRRWHS